jgi:putative copper resistance protein D
MEAALAACRFAHFLAVMMAFGTALYLSVFTPETLRAVFAGPFRLFVRAAAAVALVTAIMWVALEGAGMSGDWADAWDPDTLEAVLFDTAFGRVWQAHIALCLALVIASGLDGRWVAITAAAALSVASLGLTGHASMQTGAIGVAHRANDALHLLCGGAWLGGLIPFVLCLRMSGRPGSRGDAIAAMLRYSRCGHAFVPLAVLSGMANVALTTGALPFPISSPYRALLAIKIAVVATMIAVALFNRYVLVPRLAARPGAAIALRAASVAEVALGAVAVAFVAVFGLLDPA